MFVCFLSLYCAAPSFPRNYEVHTMGNSCAACDGALTSEVPPPSPIFEGWGGGWSGGVGGPPNHHHHPSALANELPAGGGGWGQGSNGGYDMSIFLQSIRTPYSIQTIISVAFFSSSPSSSKPIRRSLNRLQYRRQHLFKQKTKKPTALTGD